LYRGELDFPASTQETARYSPEDFKYGDAAHCRAALHRPDVSPAEETAKNTIRTSQNGEQLT